MKPAPEHGHVDLHAHSTASDGTQAPAALVVRARQAGLAAVAITDHDTLGGAAEAVAEGERLGIEVVCGTELSAVEGEDELHLLALHVSDVARLEGELASFRRMRVARAEEMVAKLAALGIAVSMEDVLKEAAGGAVGRPHVARAMVARGAVRDMREAFDRFIGGGRVAYVPKEQLPVADAIRLAHESGAIAVAAHLGSDGTREYVEGLRRLGLDGLEVRHPSHSADDIARLGALADHYGMVKSGGSDWHGANDGPRALGVMQVPRVWLDQQRERAEVVRRAGGRRGGRRRELQGRVALVTGAGRRLGRAIALALGARGMRVAVHYNASADGAQETAALIERAGGEARVLGADLTVARDCEQLVDAAAVAFGALDVVVNSAAVMMRTPVGEVTAEQWDEMFALNLRAPFFIAQRAAPHLARTRGAIVNIADLAAFETWPAYVPHGIMKAGVVQMTRALARALAPDVRVNAVAPGAVLLPDDWDETSAARLVSTTPLARLGAPEDVVQAVLYLLDAEYVTGETIVVDGGRHVRT